jgi:hypothetical protein
VTDELTAAIPNTSTRPADRPPRQHSRRARFLFGLRSARILRAPAGGTPTERLPIFASHASPARANEKERKHRERPIAPHRPSPKRRTHHPHNVLWRPSSYPA